MLDRPDVMSLFARQHFVVATRQLLAIDVSPDAVQWARKKKLLVTPARGVVALAAKELDFHGRALAVQLSVGDDAHVSGISAGLIHGLRGMSEAPVEIACPIERRVAVPAWARLHRTRWLDDTLDVDVRRDGLRVATPLRTLFRLASSFNQHRFERAAEDVWHRKLATPDDAAAYLTSIRRQGRTGVSNFEAWLLKTLPRDRPSQSGLELDFVELIGRSGLPEPARQHPLLLETGEEIHLDLAWPDIRLAVEPGHSWWHGGDLRTKADAARDRGCAALGWQVLRYSEGEQRDPATTRELVAIHRRRCAEVLWSADRVPHGPHSTEASGSGGGG